MMHNCGMALRFWRLRLPPPAARDYDWMRETTGVLAAKVRDMHTLRLHPFAQRESLAGPSLRHGLIARVRREIEAGIYDTPEKLEIARQRLFACMETDGRRDEDRR